MLRKLIKYELKATSLTFLPLFLAYIIASGFTRIFINNDSHYYPLLILSILLIIIYSVLSFMIGSFSIISSTQRFQKNLLKDEGYLMNTLPVTSHAIVISKLVVSFIWLISSFISIILSTIVLYIGDKFFNEIRIYYHLLFTAFSRLFSGTPLFGVEVLFLLIISFTCLILMLYASISIGHLASKNKTAGSVGVFISFFVIMIIALTALLTLLESYFNSRTNLSNLDLAYTIVNIFIVVCLFLNATFYFITTSILKNKLNLE